MGSADGGNSIREHFDLPDDEAYLNCAFMGPLPNAAAEAGRRALEAKQHPWQVGGDSFFEPVARVRELVAGFLDGDSGGVALVPSVSYGIATAAANLTVDAGQTIVMLAEQFPSNVYAWRELASDRDGEVVMVPRSEDGWATSVVDAIDEHTAIVAVPTCHWTDGSWVDLEAVGAAARTVGAALVVDVTQSLGAAPFDHAAIRPDVVVGAAYKWLLGPYTSAFLWVAPNLREGRPIELNWITRAGSEDFAGLVAYTDEFQPGARRYDSGEVSNHVGMATTAASLELLREWGVATVAEHARTLTDELATRARERGLTVAPADQRSPHLIGLGLPAEAGDPAAVAERLAANNVHVSIRGTSVRVSAHIFNTMEDIGRLVDAL